MRGEIGNRRRAIEGESVKIARRALPVEAEEITVRRRFQFERVRTSVRLFDLRDHLFATEGPDAIKNAFRHGQRPDIAGKRIFERRGHTSIVAAVYDRSKNAGISAT
jgi:hypothetical protein